MGGTDVEGTTHVETLFSSGVLVERGEAVSLSPEFEAAVADYRASVADRSRDELEGLIQDRVDEARIVDALADLGEMDPRTVAELCALSDHLRTATETDWIPLLPVLRLFRPESPPAHGAPGPFVPVTVDLVPHLARIYPRLLVYVWLDDCPPCEVLARRLKAIFKRPREVMTFAVYGPDDREFLAREYDVTAGPALLFMRNGGVDARLYGDQDDAVIEGELRKLHE